MMTSFRLGVLIVKVRPPALGGVLALVRAELLQVWYVQNLANRLDDLGGAAPASKDFV